MSSIFTPVDNMKCLILLQETTQNIKTSTFSIIKHQAQKKGIRGIFRGLPISLMRDVPGSALVFTFYEYFKRILEKSEMKYLNFISGGLASLLTWMFTYPQDIIKTRFLYKDQVAVRDIANEIFKENGIEFYKVFICTNYSS
jgi:solute carrier family 25 carnitine/acylcarnitine transporter 20/29